MYVIYCNHICDFIADCEYVGHAVAVKKIIPRELRKKTSKKQGNAGDFVNFVIY